MTDELDTAANAPCDAAGHRSVCAEWTLRGTFVGGSFVALDDLVRPLPLSRLLDEFSLAALMRRDGLSRLIHWPTIGAATVALDASFTVVCDGTAERAGIVMVAIDPRSEASNDAYADHVMGCLHGHVGEATSRLGPATPLEDMVASAERREAAQAIAAAMITFAGGLRDLSEQLGSLEGATDGNSADEPSRSAGVPSRDGEAL